MLIGLGGLGGLQGERQFKPERAAFAFPAVQTNLATERVYQLPGNGGAQPAAAKAAGDAWVGLGKAVENA